MSDFKEFQGKTLDAAIAEACAYYDAPREKLEIDIVEDAKTGIFGLVGARKARIRARRAQLPDLPGRGKQPRQPDAQEGASENTGKARQGRGAKTEKTERQPKGRKQPEAADSAPTAPLDPASPVTLNTPDTPDASAAADEETTPVAAEAREEDLSPAQAEAYPDNDVPTAAPADREPRRGRTPRAPRVPRSDAAGLSAPYETAVDNGPEGDMPELALPRVALSDLDQDKLRAVTADMVKGLVFPIVGEVPLEVTLSDDRVQVRVDCDDTGLLIGREGQNLAAVQYLAARMVTRAMGAQVRVQVDAGDYRSRQDSHLQELAHSLADKVRATGKSQSTRPLSAYQRRVIHLTLQDAPDVQTRSSGEGALKRVVVQRRKEQN